MPATLLTGTTPRNFWQQWLLAAALALCSHAVQAQEQEADTALAPAAVQSLRYGTTLFHYFQQDYFNALTELLAAQQLDELGVHADHGALLRGGVSLSYGMDQVAEGIFETLLAQPEFSADRERAWFYLGKLAWQRGDLERAARALEKMSPTYDGPSSDEADYLRAVIALRRGDGQVAADTVQRMPINSPWGSYLQYNLGAMHAARGEWDRAVAYFDGVVTAPLSTSEHKALRDKALTASGYAYLGAHEYQQAADDFVRVRRDSPLVARALLGFGWAYSERGEFQQALSPWQVLGEQSLLNDSVRESLLAIPYAYEQLGRHRTALSQYQHASEVYAAELQSVQAAIEVFQVGDLSQQLALLEGTTPDLTNGQDWLSGQALLPQGEHLPYIAHLITQHDFQIAMRELQDLHSMALYLGAASQRLRVLVQVDNAQQQSWASVLEGDRLTVLRERQRQLQQRSDDLVQRVQAAQSPDNARLLAGAEQQALWQRLERAAALANTTEHASEHSARLALYRGLLIWQDNENYPARSWQLKRAAEELQALAAQSQLQVASVEQAMATRRQSAFAARIVDLQTRVQLQEVEVQSGLQGAQAYVRQLAVNELQQQAGNLLRAMGQSRLAIARLYDTNGSEVLR